MKPVKKYANADLEKLQIIKDNKGKAGVYCWRNLTNGKIYIGSSVDLGTRFSAYYSIKYLESKLKKGRSIIYSSILKYGYSNFSLEIIEYCEQSETTSREQFFLDKLNPDYNISKIAGYRFGCTHTDDTKEKMSLAKKNMFDETRAKMSAAKKGNSYAKGTRSDETKEKMKGNKNGTGNKGRKRPEGAGSPPIAIEVFDLLTKKKTTYPSISAAAKALDVSLGGLSKYIYKNIIKACAPFKGRYEIIKIEK